MDGGTAAVRVARKTKFAPANPAPHQCPRGDRHNHQRNKLLPIHGHNIRSIPHRAMENFCAMGGGVGKPGPGFP